MEHFLQLLIIGVALGSTYTLIALGLILIYKSSRVVNFAQGELVMVGAFVAYTLLVRANLPPLLALIMTPVLTGALGYAIELLILRRVSNGPVITVIMITLGLSIMLKGVVMLFAGTSNYAFPQVFPEFTIHMVGVAIPHIYVWNVVVATVLLIGFLLFFKYTRLGLAMRATADNAKAAVSLGVRSGHVVALSWAVSGAVASAGGVLLGSISVLNVGLSGVGLIAFPILILGGLDSLAGAVVGGLLIGILQTMAGGYLNIPLNAAVDEVVAYLVLLLVLLVRPYGLFGTREVERL